jgi:hypothetical protein
MSHDAVEQAVQRVVALRRVADAVLDPEERRRLERVIRELRREIGVGVPKRRAARLLGVSVQALEPWVAGGRNCDPGPCAPRLFRVAVLVH